MTNAQSEFDRLSALSKQLEVAITRWFNGSASDQATQSQAMEIASQFLEIIGDLAVLEGSTQSDSARSSSDETVCQAAAHQVGVAGALCRAIQISTTSPIGGDNSAEEVRRLNLRRATKLLGPVPPGRFH